MKGKLTVGMVVCCPDEHFKVTVHGTTLEKQVLNSVNSIMTFASPLLYTKHINFLKTPETREGKLLGWDIPKDIAMKRP